MTYQNSPDDTLGQVMDRIGALRRIHLMTMRCPNCGEIESVECVQDQHRHVHECNVCGHKDIYGKPRD